MQWEEERKESKYAADLIQLPAERKVSPVAETWKCDFTGVTDNLWLNLSDGTIGSGRQHWDGSGGNGAHRAASVHPHHTCITSCCTTLHIHARLHLHALQAHSDAQ